MPRNVVITPLSGLVDFYDLNSNLDAKIQIDDTGNLNISNSGGTLSIGNAAANVYIGDGTNSVDMIFEQNGAIRALTGKTLTLGNSASNITVQSPLTINSAILNTTTTGYFEVRQTVSSWTNSTSHPIIKWDYNATYDDHLYLASGGNAGGTTQSALVIGETNILIGKANATPNASSVLSTTSTTIQASTGNITTIGSISSAGTGYRVSIGTDSGGSIHLGRIDNVTSSPYIDFNSGATTVDHDVRLQASGGSGANGGGTLTLTGNLSITGNLTVNGTTTTVNSTTVTVDDPIFTLGGDTAPTSDDNKDRGIEFRWHNGTAAKVGFFGFDDSTGYLTFIPDATNTSEVFSGTLGDIQATNFRGNLIGNADTATNGVVTTGSYANPAWITSLSETKVLPSQTSQSGKYLTTNGTSTSWATVTLPSGQTAGSATSGYLQYSGTTKTDGQLYGGTSAPSNTTRLNFDGHLYATKFFGDGSSLTGINAGATITDDTTSNATRYLLFDDVTSGSATSVGVSSTKLTFNPSTGTLSATAFSGDGGNITNILRIKSVDDRTLAPSEVTAGYASYFFTSWNNNNTSPYADALLLRSYTDATGGKDNLVMFRKDAIGMRIWQQDWGSATAFATYKDVAFTGDPIAGNYNVSVISTNTNAASGTVYILTASLTLTLPASPSAGNWIKVSNRSGTTTSVIARNGSNIMSLAEDMNLDVINAALTLVYADATRGWTII